MRKSLVLAVIFQFLLFNASFAQSVESLVASGNEVLTPQKVGTEDMIPVFADDIAEGEYSVETESSSSMFRIVAAKIIVKSDESGSGSIRANITLSGKSYTKLFLGTALDAASAGGTDDIPFSQNENGSYCFEFPLEALNSSIKCAAFSSKKQKWYDRDILFDASSLPEESIFISPKKQQKIALKDGLYKINVKLSGGSGRAFVKSPAYITVKDGLATAELEWSSANYDYMKVNRSRFDVNQKNLEKGGNSTFEIPVYVFDKKMPVTADTVAMSKSHEIHYWLEFDSKSAKKTKKKK
ncbi:hypothetical protein [uncultured Treponema sp.]|uniref:hypothetical protein n=1 Tax=uncultured Treponema sp. TaxID=162155 RepID=UPI0025E079B3|nr:hypothetical protein [uncultured Treponema sp.]